jgi:uncharacterized protein with GYD domain
MARYMAQVGYTSPSWRTQLESPRDPIERIQPLAQELGGRIQQVYYCFGEYDLVAICEFPDDEAMAAFALTVAAAGATRTFVTHKLLDVQQGLNAMRRAEQAASKYTPPLKEMART